MTVLQPGFGKLLGTELTLHYRNGLYIVYLVLTGFFLAIVSLVPAQSRETTLGIVILLDPAFIGFFFAGGLVLLEREQGILPVVATSAGSFAAYTRPKVVALVVLAAGVATVLLTVASLLGYVGPSVSGTLRLAIGLILAIPVFFNLGVIVAGWKPRVIEYFVYASFALLPLMIPLADMAGVSTGLVGKLSPVWGAMILITSSFTDGGAPVVMVAAVANLLVWNALTARWASRAFRSLAGGEVRSDGSRRTVAPRTRRRVRTALSGTAVDLRLMVRDPVILAMFAAPLLAAGVLGRVVPHVATLFGDGAFREAFATRYIDHIRSFALLPGIVVYGVIGSFLILDEKDGGVTPFLRTVPGRPGWYILRRGWMLLLVHLAVLGPTVFAGNLFHATPFRFVLSLLVDAAVLPVVYLAVAIIAENKVQGLAITKVINLLSLPPLLMLVIPPGWAWAVGIFPSGWGSLIRLHAATAGQALLAAAAGIVYAGTITLLLYRRISDTG
jgi:fluoroquinolone transport system permease protein